jgi:hypothetical protein
VLEFPSCPGWFPPTDSREEATGFSPKGGNAIRHIQRGELASNEFEARGEVMAKVCSRAWEGFVGCWTEWQRVMEHCVRIHTQMLSEND